MLKLEAPVSIGEPTVASPILKHITRLVELGAVKTLRQSALVFYTPGIY